MLKKNIKNIFIDTNFYLIIFKVIWKCFKRIKDYWYFYRINKINYPPEGDYFFIKNLKSVNIKKSQKLEILKDFIVEKIIDNKTLSNLLSLEHKEFLYQHIKNKEGIIKFADSYCLHNFDFLGSGKVNVSYKTKVKGVEKNNYSMNLDDNQIEEIKERTNNIVFKVFPGLDSHKFIKDYKYEPIDWHIDFKSGYRWNNQEWYHKISYGNNRGADIKVPWELSRCSHLLTLGQAYFLTGDEKYTREYIYQVMDWIENNPVLFGVNWVCTMDVAIRACNWILSLLYFVGSNLINNSFVYEFIKNIFIHGTYIHKNLEKKPFGPKTNHYLSNLTGLIYIGLFLNQTHYRKKWLNFAVKELKRQMNYQVYEDGCDYEASTCYHRLALELVFYPTIFLIKSNPGFNGKNFYEVGEKILGKLFIKKLYKMFEVVRCCIKPGGIIPQIGDNDNGRLHFFGFSGPLNMSYLLAMGAVFFKEKNFKLKELGFSEEILWLFGRDGYKIWHDLEQISIKEIESRAFLSSGWYIMRGNNNYMIISAGPNGQNGFGGHGHNDKLSFELSINGKDIIVDPGSYVYTPLPKWRNSFRSTVFHSTAVVDCKEQNRFIDKSLFLLKSDTRVKVNTWQVNDDYDFFDAEHYGYSRIPNPVTHRRQIIFDKRNSCFFIRDILNGEGKHLFEIYFHLNDLLEYKINYDNKALIFNSTGTESYKIYPVNPSKLNFDIIDSWVSYEYGKKIKSKVIKYSITTGTPFSILFAITEKDYSISSDDIKKLFGNKK